MRRYSIVLLVLLSTYFSSCLVEDGCDQDLSGTYDGIQKTFTWIGPKNKSVTLIIDGVDGDYVVTSPTGTALDEEDLDQDGCGFEFRTGPIGNKKTGQVIIEGDSIWYETSGDSYGVLPSSFSGVRR